MQSCLVDTVKLSGIKTPKFLYFSPDNSLETSVMVFVGAVLMGGIIKTFIICLTLITLSPGLLRSMCLFFPDYSCQTSFRPFVGAVTGREIFFFFFFMFIFCPSDSNLITVLARFFFLIARLNSSCHTVCGGSV